MVHPHLIRELTIDYGESHYFYKTTGALPAGSEEWVTGFDHSGWADLLPFFIAAYKNNQTLSLPTVVPLPDTFNSPIGGVDSTNETITFWYRSHRFSATATGDPLPVP